MDDTTTLTQQLFDESREISDKADGIRERVAYFSTIVGERLRVEADWLEDQLCDLHESAVELVREHGELLGRRSIAPDDVEREHWVLVTEYVVSTREEVSQIWMLGNNYALELRYPISPRSWWYALLRQLGLRRGIDRKVFL